MSTRVWKDNAQNFVEVADIGYCLHPDTWNSSGSVEVVQCYRFQRSHANRDYQHSQGEVGLFAMAKHLLAPLGLE